MRAHWPQLVPILLGIVSVVLAAGIGRADEEETYGPGIAIKNERGLLKPKAAPKELPDAGPVAAKTVPPEAGEILTRYLDAVKAKKWPKVRELTHPLTLKAIAQVKTRLGEERHSMAPWYWVNTFYIKGYKVEEITAAVHGDVAMVTENNYQVQEKGDYEGEKSAYLMGKYQGHWFVIDKKSEADGFTADSLKYGYPGYFDKD
jgi:hypothetical protein